MSERNDWQAVDAALAQWLIPPDPALDAALAANAAAGLPAIDVSPLQGRFLQLLARLMGARRVLEIGTLGGYSTIHLARAVGDGGKVVSLEIDPHHAGVAAANLARAGLAGRVDIRVGPAAETLAALAAEGGAPFDLIFIDADKLGYPVYLQASLKLARPGAVIVGDNVVRAGKVLDGASDDPNVAGVRAFLDMMGGEPRLAATAIQTVGAKGWDGFALAVVD
jgi:predicted O-methyltransferase YrrM